MGSKVYFTSPKTRYKRNILDKIEDLYRRVGFHKRIKEKEFVAIKVHWGEYGNVAIISPQMVRKVVELVKESGAYPFVTDTNTIYSGGRKNAIISIETAAKNGFTRETLGAPIIVADGIYGMNKVVVKVDGNMLNEVEVAGDIYYADYVIYLTHVKGHELFGMGGSLKNVAMGCSTPRGKKIMHSDAKPVVKPERCKACGHCVSVCPEGAINYVKYNGKKVAKINSDLCSGCGLCIEVCQFNAIPMTWETDEDLLFKKTADYAKGILSNKSGKVLFFNIMLRISPACDCLNWNDVPIIEDVGILASEDPVAIDKASYDLAKVAAVIPSSKIGKKYKSGDDPFFIATGVSALKFIEYAEKIGIGTTDYELITI